MKVKAFVYYKADSKKVTEIKDVSQIRFEKDNIVFVVNGGAELEFDTRTYKTTTYTNWGAE